MHFINYLLITLALALFAITANVANAEPKTVEFVHFWISKGERASLDMIAEKFRKLGGDWSDTTSQDYEYMKRDALMRMAVGFPPTAIWLGGEDVVSIAGMNIVRKLDDVAAEYQLSSQLYAFVMDKAKVNQNLIALPITIHNENWAWINIKVYRDLNLHVPNNWDDFLKQAPIFVKHGIMPLAISDQDWNVRLLFTTLIAGVAGPELYRCFYEKEDLSVLTEPKLQRALTILGQLRQYRPKTGMVRTWTDATQLIIDGKAAMQIMGDWAKGEFTAFGKQPGRDFACTPVPEADKSFIAALDLVAFPLVKGQDEQAGQRLLTEVLIDKDTQIDFANKKGSIPVLRNITPGMLDACAASSLPKLIDEHNRLFSPRLTMREQMRTDIQKTIADFWKNPAISVKDVTLQLKSLFKPDTDRSLSADSTPKNSKP